MLRLAGRVNGRSPHLMEVRERIRLGAHALPRALFARYFWECWDALRASGDGSLPPYFRFLTVMAFKVFAAEGVDVAVLEVGIGGRFDATNLCAPVVTGISALALEHTDLLGPTLPDIAYHKGGIIKPGVPVYSVPQAPAAAAVLENLAAAAAAPYLVVPPRLAALACAPGVDPPHPRLPGAHQEANASLALHLSHAWLAAAAAPAAATLAAAPLPQPLTAADGRALATVHWPGRSQVLVRGRVTFLLDGAHTVESCEACAEWAAGRWAAAAAASGRGGGGGGGGKSEPPVVRVLWFNLSGARDPATLLRPLAALAAAHPLAYSLFSPNVTTFKDMANAMVGADAQRALSRSCRDAWVALRPESVPFVADTINGAALRPRALAVPLSI
jgi:folylpolyglutamate synthase